MKLETTKLNDIVFSRCHTNLWRRQALPSHRLATPGAIFWKDFPLQFRFVCENSAAGFRRQMENRHHIDRSAREDAEFLWISVETPLEGPLVVLHLQDHSLPVQG